MMSPQEIRYFVEVAGTLNLSRAAERLGVSQPALTHAIGRLENDLAVKLFHRSKQGVQLTKSGEKFLASSLALIEAWEKAAASAKDAELKVEGRVKLGCHPAVARYVLPEFLSSLLKNHPDLEMHLAHGLSRHIAEEVISWRLDFGIVVNPPPHPDLIIKPICEDIVTLWVHEKCANRDVVIYDPDLLQVQSILQKLKKSKVTFKRSIHSSSLEVISTLVASGCGVGILPQRVVKSNLGFSQVQTLRSDAPSFKDRICLIYRAGTQTSQTSKKVIESILSARF